MRQEWNGGNADLLIALHARRSFDSIRRFQRDRPQSPIIVALTGTDLYSDLRKGHRVQDAMRMAERLVVLQPLALQEIPRPLRARGRVILQSMPRPERRDRPAVRTFDVCVLAHLRALKDPLRAARAARLLPEDSRIRVLHAGRALTPAMERQARREERVNPRYRWLGELTRGRALRLLRRSRLLVLSSRLEGGANAASEALVAGLPVLASHIPGNVGILGRGYPGYFPLGDTRGLAELLRRAEGDDRFRTRLESWCRERARDFDPDIERDAWRSLLAETPGPR